MHDRDSSAKKTQWLACIAALMSAICALFSAYATWKNSRYLEFGIRPQVRLGRVILHRYPTRSVVEIVGLKNMGGGDAQKCRVEIFIRENWWRGMVYWAEIHNLMRGQEYDESLFIGLGEKVKGPQGEVLPNDYFKENGMTISTKYENMWTGETYSVDWNIPEWTIEDHKKDEKK